VRTVFEHTFGGGDPAGEYEVSGCVEDPLTGNDYDVDKAQFTFTP